MNLELAQIVAADRLWNRLEELKRSDRATAALQGSLPGFDPESTLLKVLALQPIDTSKSHVGLPLAREICELLEGVDPAECGVELVDTLAVVVDRHGRSSYDGLGFASRFAHHYIDSDRFPVLDAWSERALQQVLGGKLTGAPGESRYGLFARNFTWVADRLGLIRRRRLGRWLWLAGQYAAWSANPRTQINRSVRKLFEFLPTELAGLALSTGPAVERGQSASSLADASEAEPPPALPRSPSSATPADPAYDPQRTSGGTSS